MKSRDQGYCEEEFPKKPKRPLNAYNLFFRHERGQLLDSLPERPGGKPRNSHGKLGFEDMARLVGSKWRSINATKKAKFDALALKEKERYRSEMARYRAQVREMKARSRESSRCTKSLDGTKCEPGEPSLPTVRNSSPQDTCSIAELANKLGDDGVNIVIRAFYPRNGHAQ